MKKISTALLLSGLASVPALALAAEESPHSITGNLTLVSDYQFRGVSQTDEDPAIQGGFDYAHKSGFYLGVWASNVEFGDANSEWDVYGGHAGSVGDLGYNVGLLQYIYPDLGDANTLEAYAGITYMGLGLKASYTLSDEYFGARNGDGTIYWDASYNHTFANGWGLGLHYGYTAGSGDQDDYADWKVGLGVPVGKFNFGIAYVGTDNDGRDFYGKWADDRFILSLGATF